MNKHIAVYMLNLRRVIYKVLLIIVIICAVETVLLWGETKEFFEYADNLYSGEYMDENTAKYQRSSSLVITEIFTDSKAQLVFMAGFIAVCAVFLLNGLELGGSRCSYTIHRLSLSSKVYILWESLAYLTCLFIFYASQVALSAGFIWLYNYLGGAEYYSSQSALIMFYENDFLHSLLPLRDTSRMVRNIAMMLSLAACAGCFAYRRRKGAKSIAVFIAAAFIILEFSLELGRWGTDMLDTLTVLTIAGVAVVNLWRLPDEN